MGKITGVRAKEVFLKAVQEDGALPTKRDGCKDRLFGGETVERGDVVVFNNQWPHKAPTEEYRDENNKRSDEWKNKVSKYGRRCPCLGGLGRPYISQLESAHLR